MQGDVVRQTEELNNKNAWQNNITEDEFRDVLKKIGAYRTNMSQKQRVNWNAYMRKSMQERKRNANKKIRK